MKAREVRAQEESVDALSPGSLFVGLRSATQSIMASMRSVGIVGKDMVRSSSHTITNNITLSSREYKSSLLRATSRCIDDPANYSTPSLLRDRQDTMPHAGTTCQ